MAKTSCPHCNKRFNVKPEHAGRSCSCKGCGNSFTIELISETTRPAKSPTTTSQPQSPAASPTPVPIVPPTAAMPVAPVVPVAPAVPVAPVSDEVPVAAIVPPITPTEPSNTVPVAPVAPVASFASELPSAAPSAPAVTATNSSAYEKLSGQLMHQRSGQAAILPYDQLPYIQASAANKKSDNVGWFGTHLVLRGSALMAFGAFLFVFALLGLSLWGLEFVQPFGAMVGAVAGLIGSFMVMGGLRSRMATALVVGGIPCLLFLAMGGITGYWYKAEGWGKMPTSLLANRNSSLPWNGSQFQPSNRSNSRRSPNMGTPSSNRNRQSRSRTQSPPNQPGRPFGGGASNPASDQPKSNERPVQDFFKPKEPGKKPEPKRPSIQDLQRATQDDKPTIADLIKKPVAGDEDTAMSDISSKPESGKPDKQPPEQKSDSSIADSGGAKDDPFAGIAAQRSPTDNISATPFAKYNGQLRHEMRREKRTWDRLWQEQKVQAVSDFPNDVFSERVGDENCFGKGFAASPYQEPVIGVRMMQDFSGMSRGVPVLAILHPVFSRSAKHDVIARKGYAIGGVTVLVDGKKISALQFTSCGSPMTNLIPRINTKAVGSDGFPTTPSLSP